MMPPRTAAQVAQDLGRNVPQERTPRAQHEPVAPVEDGETYFFLTINGEAGFTQMAYDILREHLPIRKMAADRGGSLPMPGREPGMIGLRGVCVITRKTDLPEQYQVD